MTFHIVFICMVLSLLYWIMTDKCHFLDTTRIWDSAYTGQIRLSRGQYSNQGLLEVYCNGQWGTVCDDSFGNTEATVACRQLGYRTYNSYDSLSMWVNTISFIIFKPVIMANLTDKKINDCK